MKIRYNATRASGFFFVKVSVNRAQTSYRKCTKRQEIGICGIVKMTHFPQIEAEICICGKIHLKKV